jgi:chromosome segregation ATPase
LNPLQEAAVASDRCAALERQATSLTSQLAAAAAAADVAAEEKQRLQAAIDRLNLRLEQKEARMRSSMGALARASSSLRASLASVQVRLLMPSGCCSGC